MADILIKKKLLNLPILLSLMPDDFTGLEGKVSVNIVHCNCNNYLVFECHVIFGCFYTFPEYNIAMCDKIHFVIV